MAAWVAGAALLATTLAGCTGKHPGAAPTAASSAAPTAASAVPPGAYPQNARTLANRVPACSPAPLGSSDSAAPGFAGISGVFATASSSAQCAIRGSTVVIFGFSSAPDQARNEAYLRRADAYFAAGAGWTAAPEQVGEPPVEQSLVQDVAIALGGRIHTGSG